MTNWFIYFLIYEVVGHVYQYVMRVWIWTRLLYIYDGVQMYKALVYAIDRCEVKPARACLNSLFWPITFPKRLRLFENAMRDYLNEM